MPAHGGPERDFLGRPKRSPRVIARKRLPRWREALVAALSPPAHGLKCCVAQTYSRTNERAVRLCIAAARPCRAVLLSWTFPP